MKQLRLKPNPSATVMAATVSGQSTQEGDDDSESDHASVYQEQEVPYSYEQESDPLGLQTAQHGEHNDPMNSDSYLGMVNLIICLNQPNKLKLGVCFLQLPLWTDTYRVPQ